MTEKPTHSPLGASSAERWMTCPGSYTLLSKLELPPTEEKDFQVEGTAAHEALAHCLKNGSEAWEIVGQEFNKVIVSQEMADAIQVFLSRDSEDLASEIAAVREFTEVSLQHPQHELCYGTVDRGLVWPGIKRIKVKDFKYGAGIAVEVKENPQIMYYAYLLLSKLDIHEPHEWRVELEIVQPRIDWHPDGIIRTWETDAQYILDWGNSTLLPAMQAAQIDLDFVAGEHCRFCPAKLVCPLMRSLYGAAMQADPNEIKELTTDELARAYGFKDAVKHYIRAMEEEMMRRLMAGQKHPAVKLVQKKANRVWKSEAKDELIAKLGADKVFTEPAFKGPAEIEKLGVEAKKLVKEFAFTPNTGFTVAMADDKRVAVTIETAIQAFPNILDLVKESA